MADDWDFPFSEESYETAFSVLSLLSDNIELYKSKPMRKLRCLLQQFFLLQKSDMFGGSTIEEYRSKQMGKRMSSISENKKKVEDKKFLEKTKLRAGRLKHLSALAEQDSLSNMEAMPTMLMDGAVETESYLPAQPLLISNNANESVNSSMADPVVNSTDDGTTLHNSRSCYICKAKFRELHEFYDTLCPTCAALNFRKRNQTTDLFGRVCIVTGGRVKIGFHCCLKLLRAGAVVVSTSRFPIDSAGRFAQQPDYDVWRGRLHVVGLDLRDIIAVEEFCHWIMDTFSSLDAIINNACQTIRRPPVYYQHLMEKEMNTTVKTSNLISDVLSFDMKFQRRLEERNSESLRGSIPRIEVADVDDADVEDINSSTRIMSSSAGPGSSDYISSAKASQVPLLVEDNVFLQEHNRYNEKHQRYQAERSPDSLDTGGGASTSNTSCTSVVAETVNNYFPTGVVDVNNQQLDLRTQNSWLFRMHHVSTPELTEVFAINSISPFILVARLKGMMTKAASTDAAINMKKKSTGVLNDKNVPVSKRARRMNPNNPWCLDEDQAGNPDAVEVICEGIEGNASAVKVENNSKDKDMFGWKGGSGNYQGHGPQKQAMHEADSSSANTTESTAKEARNTIPRVPAAHCSFVVNVSSMEGKFYRRKLATHPHTNMVLGIVTYMCCVDCALCNVTNSVLFSGEGSIEYDDPHICW